MNALRVFTRSSVAPSPARRLDQIRKHLHIDSSLVAMTTKIAIIAGVGAGTGGEVAKRFAKHYPVYLLSRNPENSAPLVKEIEAAGGKAFGISADVTKQESLTAGFNEIKKHAGTGDKTAAAAAIFNASSPWKREPFLKLTETDFVDGFTGSAHGAFLFAQQALPLLLNGVEDRDTSDDSYRPPTLVFTGATASVKGSAQFAAFAPGKWAVRALSQSLAREFGPQGVHVSHAVIDGVIDGPRVRHIEELAKVSKIEPSSIAETYFYLHSQPRTSFTWEVDIRPFVEKW